MILNLVIWRMTGIFLHFFFGWKIYIGKILLNCSMRFADIQVIVKKTLVSFSNKLERWQKIANIKGSPKKNAARISVFFVNAY